VGGTRPLAHVLTSRPNQRAPDLTALGEQDSQLADEVRRFMFVFDDIVLLDDRAMQRVIRELDAKDMALALRPATEQLRLKFFQNMSQRAAEMLREEMSLAGQVRMKAVEESQQRIIDIIKKLEDEDQISINRGAPKMPSSSWRLIHDGRAPAPSQAEVASTAAPPNSGGRVGSGTTVLRGNGRAGLHGSNGRPGRSPRRRGRVGAAGGTVDGAVLAEELARIERAADERGLRGPAATAPMPN